MATEKALSVLAEVEALLAELGVARTAYTGGALAVHSPITGERIGDVQETSPDAAHQAIADAHAAFLEWRNVPAPRRGELVRLLGEELRAHKAELGRLVSIEAGKIVSEGLGEVQEMIDICDFAVGPFAPTVRPHHRHRARRPPDDGDLASARAWSASSRRSTSRSRSGAGTRARVRLRRSRGLEAIGEDAAHRARRRRRSFERARQALRGGRNAGADGICRALLIGGRELGEALVDDPRVPLVSATGSTAMGRDGRRRASPSASAARSWNSAATTPPSSRPSADLDLALRAIAFAAMGTAGQRCTTLRRLFVHDSVYDSARAAPDRAPTPR